MVCTSFHGEFVWLLRIFCSQEWLSTNVMRISKKIAHLAWPRAKCSWALFCISETQLFTHMTHSLPQTFWFSRSLPFLLVLYPAPWDHHANTLLISLSVMTSIFEDEESVLLISKTSLSCQIYWTLPICQALLKPNFQQQVKQTKFFFLVNQCFSNLFHTPYMEFSEASC